MMTKSNMQIKPTFVWRQHLIFGVVMIVLPWTVFVYFLIGTDKTIKLYEAINYYIYSLFFPCLVILWLLFVRFISHKITSFSMLDRSIQYRCNLIALFQKRINYQDIKEITLDRGIFQRIFGLGTINVITNATAEDVGIELFNIKEYQEVYDYLMTKLSN